MKQGYRNQDGIPSDDGRISRREFFRTAGSAAAVLGTVAAGCAGNGGGASSAETAAGQMTFRTDPGTGDKVSLLGYGCMRWPMTKDGEGKEIIDQAAVNRLIDTAMAHGVNYYDTSPVYCQGLSEKATATALSRHPRDSYFIATKLSNFSNWTRENSLLMYRKSFENLMTDHIDYYLLHSVGGGGVKRFNARYMDNGVMDFLMKEREAGRIRHLGFSYHGDVKVFDYLLSRHDFYKWDFVQIQMNYLDWRYAKQINPNNTDAEYLYNELASRNIPVVIMEPLLGGRLSNVTDNIVALLKQREPEKSVASWAFRFAGSYPGVLTVLSGMTRMEHLQDNLRTYSPLDTLTGEELDFLQDIATRMMQFDTIPCNDCKYCMPCPYGIDIPAILLHYNKCLNEGNTPASSREEGYRKARRAYLVGYDRSVPKLRQADHCIGCNQCSPHCPQRIDIPKEMQRINDYVEKLRQDTL